MVGFGDGKANYSALVVVYTNRSRREFDRAIALFVEYTVCTVNGSLTVCRMNK